jgi:hypothetical protein
MSPNFTRIDNSVFGSAILKEDHSTELNAKHITLVVCLLETKPTYSKTFEKDGIKTLHVPIRYHGCPSFAQLDCILKSIYDTTISGKNVLIHYLNATTHGSVVLCAHFHHKNNKFYTITEAIHRVRMVIRHAMLNYYQEDFIISYFEDKNDIVYYLCFN